MCSPLESAKGESLVGCPGEHLGHRHCTNAVGAVLSSLVQQLLMHACLSLSLLATLKESRTAARFQGGAHPSLESAQFRKKAGGCSLCSFCGALLFAGLYSPRAWEWKKMLLGMFILPQRLGVRAMRS